uniref:Uncharacterized protein n=1 Tax=Auxenochlorella protothecoides TaxID=3075 RepID=A0A1D2A9A2_AUXPR
MKTSRSIEASKGADPSHSGHGVEASRASSSDDGTAQRGGSLSRRGSRTSLPRTSSARPAKSVTLPEGKAFLVVTLLFLLSLIMAAHLFRPRDILLDVDEMDLPMTDTSFSRQASLGIPPTPSLDDDRSRDAKQLQNSIAVTRYGLVAQSAPSPPPVHPASPLAVLKPASSWDERGNTCNMALELDRVALLFLTKGDLFHHQTWSAWFRSAQGMLPVSNVEEAVCNNFTTAEALRSFCDMTGTDSEGQRALDPDEVVLDRQYLFSVYVHAPPNIAEKDMRPLFKGRLIKDRIYTGWGSHQLVEAERNLLWHAYQDPANTRFVLLSESDIPLYHPLVLYSQVMAENLSRVNACKSANQDHRRWSWRMSRKGLKSSHWRKSSQWFMLIREHATLVLNDTEVFRSFEAHCRGGYDSDYRRNRDCFSDEHRVAFRQRRIAKCMASPPRNGLTRAGIHTRIPTRPGR